MSNRQLQILTDLRDDTPAFSALWAGINLLQWVYLALLSVAVVVSATITTMLTFNRDHALWLARKVWAPGIFAAAGVRVLTRGFDALDYDKEGYVFAFSHESLVDTPLAFYAVPDNVRFVAKKEVSAIPFIGFYCWMMNFVMVDRSNHDRAVKTLEAARDAVASGENLIVFPEGTRSKDGHIQAFKKGPFVIAIDAQAKVVPVAIVGAADMLPAGSAKIRPTTIEVHAGEPIDAAAYTYETKEELMRAVRNRIIDLHLAAGGKGGDRHQVVKAPGQR